MSIDLWPVESAPIGMESLVDGPYVSYSYAYPHKTAYRSIAPAIPLTDVWQDEDTSALFLYLHIPFCEHRCGFCNLFTQANPEAGLPARYLRQLRAEAEQVFEAIEDPRFVRLAIGGGTPTFLNERELQDLLSVITDVMQVDGKAIPVSIETSPATIDCEKLELLHSFGVDRVSLGVQSFDQRDARQIGRPQRSQDVYRALDLIREHHFPVLNVDLIYGGDGQTTASWIRTIDRALTWKPEEIYLYPLYVRPLTGLGRKRASWDDHRLELYRSGRDRLLARGYRQVSMRMFQRSDLPEVAAPEYCCQSDGMVGLGCGARSYTRCLHYSTEFAVGRANVRSILSDYLNRDADSFRAARHGFLLSPEEQARRHLIMSLLQADGLARQEYQQRFGTDVLTQFPELNLLRRLGLANIDKQCIRLTASGLERSDAIGPSLYSPNVRQLTAEYEHA